MITEVVSIDEKHGGHIKTVICHVERAEIVKLEAVMEREERWHGGNWLQRRKWEMRERKKHYYKKSTVIPDFNFDDIKKNI